MTLHTTAATPTTPTAAEVLMMHTAGRHAMQLRANLDATHGAWRTEHTTAATRSRARIAREIVAGTAAEVAVYSLNEDESFHGFICIEDAPDVIRYHLLRGDVVAYRPAFGDFDFSFNEFS